MYDDKDLNNLYNNNNIINNNNTKLLNLRYQIWGLSCQLQFEYATKYSPQIKPV